MTRGLQKQSELLLFIYAFQAACQEQERTAAAVTACAAPQLGSAAASHRPGAVQRACQGSGDLR